MTDLRYFLSVYPDAVVLCALLFAWVLLMPWLFIVRRWSWRIVIAVTCFVVAQLAFETARAIAAH